MALKVDMRAEKNRREDGVVEFPRPQVSAESMVARREKQGADSEAESSRRTVLNAERGIINTGIVHGGQHITTAELSNHVDGGADGDI
ncbi:S-type pyocin domain-containing protein [Streptomyces sp. NPDC001493]